MQNSLWPGRNRICQLFGIEHPIVQAGMVWVSGGKLAAAASNAGCLGLVGAGSMKPELLERHIRKTCSLTNNPFGVNIPLLYEKTGEQIDVALKEGVKIFFTSAGSPKTWTKILKEQGATVVHVTSHPDLVKKCEDAGVDAVVVEGFEAGGHNGRDELTTLVLLQQVFGKTSLPVLAAGGIGTGSAIAACLALGAAGAQIGTRFAATQESSAHENFKRAMQEAGPSKTFLRMKRLVPVRLLENPFAKRVAEAEEQCVSSEVLEEILGKGRARQGMLEGNLEEGELEVGQIVSEVQNIPTCQELVQRLIEEYQAARLRV